jgi:hypothetical protein
VSSWQTTRYACCLGLGLLVACGARRGPDGAPGDDTRAAASADATPGLADPALPDGTASGDLAAAAAGEATGPDAGDPPERGPWVGPAVEQTAPRDVLCAETGYQPIAPADVDGDGRLDRLAARRDGNQFVLTLHALPELDEVARWTIRADYVEPALTRRGETTAGDLWLHVGVVTDPETSTWEFTLRHLVDGELQVLSTAAGSGRPNLMYDLDGDGTVDPIVDGDGGPLALLPSGPRQLAATATATRFAGLPAPYGRQTPVDLDGDGDLDLAAETTTDLLVVEAATLREVWRFPSTGTLVDVVPWSAAPGGAVIAGLVDVTGPTNATRLFAAEVGHRELGAWVHGDGDYVRIRTGVDPAGDGSLLPLSPVLRSALLAAPGETPEPLELEFASTGEPAESALRPARFAGGAGPELPGTRMLGFGSPAMGGTGESVYELRLVPPPGRGAGRLVRTGELPGEGGPSVWSVDLEGDGTRELLLEETTSYMTCDMSGGGSTARWLLLRGDGTLLWRDDDRHREFGEGYRHDGTADARLLELGSRRGLRLRTASQEWWVFAAGTAPAALPACLE